MIGRVNPPEAQQTIAPITFFSNTRPLNGEPIFQSPFCAIITVTTLLR